MYGKQMIVQAFVFTWILYLFQDRFAFGYLFDPSHRKTAACRETNAFQIPCTLFTATRRRVESELWRKDCSITTATSEVRVQHLSAGLDKDAGERRATGK